MMIIVLRLPWRRAGSDSEAWRGFSQEADELGSLAIEAVVLPIEMDVVARDEVVADGEPAAKKTKQRKRRKGAPAGSLATLSFGDEEA